MLFFLDIAQNKHAPSAFRAAAWQRFLSKPHPEQSKKRGQWQGQNRADRRQKRAHRRARLQRVKLLPKRGLRQGCIQPQPLQTGGGAV